ncbi:MAG: DUF2092 domain-containing protein [Planctomycetota bacterium]
MTLILTRRLLIVLLASSAALPGLAVQDEERAVEKPVDKATQVPRDDPEAHALYDAMVATMREAQSLSWVSEYSFEYMGMVGAHVTYKIWLAKPNFARVEVQPSGSEQVSGILVGDGDEFWTYWPNGKPQYPFETTGKYGEEYAKYKDCFYMHKMTPVGRHSIGHEVSNLGGMGMTIIDPSTFHGYTDSLQPYLDSVRSLGSDDVDGEECDVIEVSFMSHQRSWYLWLSRECQLPRKLKEVVRVSQELTIHETWTDLAIDEEIAPELFQWELPEGWKEWRLPDLEEGLLKTGTEAPDFELASINGGTLKLSSFRGNVVWLNKWRCG